MRAAVLLLILILPFVLTGDVSKPPSSNPRLILILIIDQMRFDYLTRFEPLYQGGLRWLLAHGAVFSNARYRQASTETGPGHAALLTGRHGSHSGIVANNWYDSFLKTEMNVVDDPVQTAVGGNGRGASPANLIGFTIGDALKKASPKSQVVTISLKDRSAVLMGGKRGDAAYWYDPKTGKFVSSTYYMDHLPDWVEKWNTPPYPDQFAGKKWERLRADLSLYAKYAGPDAVEGEFDRIRTTFPHVISEKPPDPKYYQEFPRTPFADEMTVSLAMKAMKAYELGTNQATDVFAVGFSATDIIGHTYGPDSQEIMDQMLRLDQNLQTLFEVIDKGPGLSNTLMILSADHGVMPLVENLKARGIDAKRVPPSELEQAVTKALSIKFSDASGLVEYDSPHFYLRNDEIIKRNLHRKDVEETVVNAVRESGFAAAVYTHADMQREPPSGDPYFLLVRNIFFEPRSPDIFVVLKEYIYMDDYVGGTGHGTLYDYDRHVPIVFAGPGIRAARYDQACGPEDIVPTLAVLLKLSFPKEDDARILTEAFTNNGAQ
jgi:predicted AlkP superfamily pyrophosphatase or phosphodiesterase